MKPPNSNSDYTPTHASKLSADLSRAGVFDVSDIDDATRIMMLSALLQAIESGLKIGIEHFVEGATEPYPGAAATVLRQTRDAISLAKQTGLLKSP